MEFERGVMVVAHPDDEALWGSGLLMRSPKQWEVICCSVPERDPERAELFLKSCERMGVNSRLIRQPENNIQFDFNLDEFDLIVTHNKDGEYGHPHHKWVHQEIRHRWPEKTWSFGYRPKGASIKDYVVELSPEESARKLEAIRVYDNLIYGKPTWAMLLEAFAHKFDLWKEPYQKPYD